MKELKLRLDYLENKANQLKVDFLALGDHAECSLHDFYQRKGAISFQIDNIRDEIKLAKEALK